MPFKLIRSRSTPICPQSLRRQQRGISLRLIRKGYHRSTRITLIITITTPEKVTKRLTMRVFTIQWLGSQTRHGTLSSPTVLERWKFLQMILHRNRTCLATTFSGKTLTMNFTMEKSLRMKDRLRRREESLHKTFTLAVMTSWRPT